MEMLLETDRSSPEPRVKYPEFDSAQLQFYRFTDMPQPSGVPDEFRDHGFGMHAKRSPWTELAVRIFFEGFDFRKWELEPSIEAPPKEIIQVVRKVLNRRDIGHDYKLALAGWCLASWFRRIAAVDGSITIGG